MSKNPASQTVYQRTPHYQQATQDQKRRRKTRTGESDSGPNARKPRLRLGKRDEEFLFFLYLARYARSDQIAEFCFHTVKELYRRKATQRRAKQLADADPPLIRAIELPVYRRDRSGTTPLLYTLADRGGDLVADRLGISLRDIDTRPKSRERNPSYLMHDIGIVDYWLALRRSCTQAGISLESWVKDHLLQKEQDRVEIMDEDGASKTLGLISDATFVLAVPGSNSVARVFHEYDRATVTLEPGAGAWTTRSWQLQVRKYLALLDSGRLKERYGTDVLCVHIVTEAEGRLANMVRVAEEVAGERASTFFFTTTTLMREHNLLTSDIWTVGGKPDRRYAFL